ncbi:MAG: GNAT family N-acetyltransferase [Pseudobdellovibrionaceae bacterium]
MEITLTPANPRLAEWWYESRQEAETRKYNPLAPSTVESLRERIIKASSDFKDFDIAENYFWVVRVDDKVAGHVTVQNINRMMLTAEIGYGISANLRGKGIGAYAVKQLAEMVFAQTPIRKLIAFVHEDNIASRKLLKNVGFHQEGVLREHYLINGNPSNEVIYGLLWKDMI